MVVELVEFVCFLLIGLFDHSGVGWLVGRTSHSYEIWQVLEDRNFTAKNGML